LDLGEYKKLAEYVLLKDERGEKYVIDAIGTLRDILINKLQS
jgi:hypothetical protein